YLSCDLFPHRPVSKPSPAKDTYDSGNEYCMHRSLSAAIPYSPTTVHRWSVRRELASVHGEHTTYMNLSTSGSNKESPPFPLHSVPASTPRTTRRESPRNASCVPPRKPDTISM